MNFTPPIIMTPGGTRLVSATNEFGLNLGQLAQTRDGRRFRWGRAATGSVFTVPGLPATTRSEDWLHNLNTFSLLQANGSPGGVFRHGVRIYKATAPGPIFGSPFPQSFFSSLVTSGPASTSGGCQHALLRHSAIPSGGGTITVEIELAADDGITAEEPTNMGTFQFAGSKYDNLDVTGVGNQTPTTVSGVFVMPIPAGYYGWLQVSGLCPLRMDTPVGRGQPVMRSLGLPGRVDAFQTPNAGVPPEIIIGYAVAGTNAGALGMIDLTLPGE